MNSKKYKMNTKLKKSAFWEQQIKFKMILNRLKRK